jgi:hypothetical protein
MIPNKKPLAEVFKVNRPSKLKPIQYIPRKTIFDMTGSPDRISPKENKRK